MNTLRCTLLVVLTTHPAFAGPLEVEVGSAAVAFDTPASASETVATAMIGASVRVDARVPVGIRMHMSIGRQGAGLRVLGAAYEMRRGAFVIDTGAGIASVLGASAAMDSLRARGVGVALDLRIGYAVGPVTISGFALPTYVFASDGFVPEASLRSAIEAGISIGRAL